jgi:hypothetical protein
MMQNTGERCMPSSILPGLPTDGDATRGALLGELASVDSRICRLFPPSSAVGDDFTVYTGLAGVALFYWAVGVGRLSEEVGGGGQHMLKAVEYINAALRSSAGEGQRMSSRRVSTFMTGMAGVYAVAAAIYISIGQTSKAAQFAGKVLEQVKNSPPCDGPITTIHPISLALWHHLCSPADCCWARRRKPNSSGPDSPARWRALGAALRKGGIPFLPALLGKALWRAAG